MMAASGLPANPSGLFVEPREDWLALTRKRSSIPRGRSSIRIIISGIAAAIAI